jgi:predicted porin
MKSSTDDNTKSTWRLTMKNLLLGTTAVLGSLALVAQAEASPLTVTVGGEVGYQLGYTNEDLDTNLQKFGSQRLTEITLGAKGVASNGLEYGANLSLETDRFVEDDDILFIGSVFAQSELGRLEAGNQESVTSQMAIFAPSDFGTGGIAGDYLHFVSTNSVLFRKDGNTSLVTGERGYLQFNSDESNKINYVSPEFAGFQFGFTYAPMGDDTRRGVDRSKSANSVSPFSRGIGDFKNIYEVALAYTGEFGGLGVGLYGGYVGGSARDEGATPDFRDLRTYQVGLELAFQGFTVAGGYVDNGRSGYLTTATNTNRSRAWNAGVQYETGPFVVGVNYLNSRNEGDTAVPADNKVDVYSGGVTYVIADGLRTFGEVTRFNSKESTVANNNKGTVFILGSALAF